MPFQHQKLLFNWKAKEFMVVEKLLFVNSDNLKENMEQQRNASIFNHEMTADDGSNLCTAVDRESNLQVTYLHFPALPASIVNLSGAGDCLVAGALVALSAGSDLATALAHGVSAAKWAVESQSNVPPRLSHTLVSGKWPLISALQTNGLSSTVFILEQALLG